MADALAMVVAIKGAMEKDIAEATWMSSETKQDATAKLHAVVDRIGYPDTWRSYAALHIARDDALGNFQRSMAFDRRRSLADIDQPVDRGRWLMTPPTATRTTAKR